jgi:hypothetical protein
MARPWTSSTLSRNTCVSALPSRSSSVRTTTAPGPSKAPPGVAREGAPTKISPLGAAVSVRASTTLAYWRMQKPAGTVAPVRAAPSSRALVGRPSPVHHQNRLIHPEPFRCRRPAAGQQDQGRAQRLTPSGCLCRHRRLPTWAFQRVRVRQISGRSVGIDRTGPVEVRVRPRAFLRALASPGAKENGESQDQKSCVFQVVLPRQPRDPAALISRRRRAGRGERSPANPLWAS